MEFIKATKEDLKQIVDIVQESIGTVYPKYYMKEIVDFFIEYHCKENILKDIDSGCVMVLKKDDIIIGTGTYKEKSIERLYVVPNLQNQGYGSYIMDCLEDEIALKYDVIYLESSLPAVHLYEKRGYKTIRHENHLLKNGSVFVYGVMEKHIS